MLPVAIGLPVMLVDNLDRNTEKQLLRGKEGHIHSWIEDLDEMGTDGDDGDRRLSHVPLRVRRFSHECMDAPRRTRPWHISRIYN